MLVKPILSVLGVTDQIQKMADEKPLLPYGFRITIVDVLKSIVGILFWWRAVKAIVFLGWPFMFGVSMGEGRQTGRSAAIGHIGDQGGTIITNSWKFDKSYDGEFWFGLVARTHPSSDKIVRSRIEFLSLALPFGWTFLAQEGRIFALAQSH